MLMSKLWVACFGYSFGGSLQFFVSILLSCVSAGEFSLAAWVCTQYFVAMQESSVLSRMNQTFF